MGRSLPSGRPVFTRKIFDRLPCLALVACAGLAACVPGSGADALSELVEVAEEAGEMPPEAIEELVIRVTGRDYGWHLRYPGPDGRLGTDDDVEAERHIYVPSGTHVRLELESDDYMYQLGLPDFGVREIAVPDLHFSMEFDSGASGKHRLEGDQFCGFSHPDLFADLVVLPPKKYRDWVAAHR